MASISWATFNLNSSKSNINRVVSDPDKVKPSHVAAILDKLDQLGPGVRVNEATVQEILQKVGVPPGQIKKIIVLTTPKNVTVILVTDLKDEDEAKRIAINDPGMPAEKPSKGTTK
jgi:hypothetical protein